ncbi:alkaline phosphatase-like protein [Auriscalpium vulgare]|uniref:Alkaline phosphatase-like protein n=1 Tax=Auriscalpium vulgare TaxID=40419 RepID=A0ACB8RHY9_9AGAM|nr:alkaline phosphatase-like protein [Auriscalpium vulgare]
MLESSYRVVRLLCLGIIFHLVYIGTVFDCYFTSPVVHGMLPHKLQHAPSRRLVLIVGDGLRADFVFSANASNIVPGVPEHVAPYLRSVVEYQGAYGVSHTRVPTESRPGHVAIIGGMYEDVSAVTKGWKTNPVDFDSVFNRSRHTFSFGSPDILPMFARGATPGKVQTWSYDEDDEDFTKDATALDYWVIDHLKTLLRNASADTVLDDQLRQPQVVFFLHLLGLDTTGHAYRPHSKEYMEGIRVVDDIVRETEVLMSDFYGDEGTSFIFTADHGMSRIGNHGDGDPDNTRTPLIAWGSGIRGPIPTSAHSKTGHDKYSAPWKLDHLVRRDVEQGDIAALMSALLGADWPVNSVGVLPDVDPTKPGYLTTDGEEDTAQAALVNARVILEHYRVKHELKKSHILSYKEFRGIDHSLSGTPGSSELAEIELLIGSRSYRAARQKSWELIQAALKGLRYLETYDRTLIRTIVTAAYSGWIAYSATSLLTLVSASRSRSSFMSTLFVGALSTFWTIFMVQRSPWTFYVYILFPLYFWHDVVTKLWSFSGSMARGGLPVGAWSLWRCAAGFVTTTGILQAMVFLFIFASMIVTASSVRNLQAKAGLPVINQVLGWTIFLATGTLPLFAKVPPVVEAKLLVYFLAFCPCFILLSIRAEGLFYVSYTATLYVWTQVEDAMRNTQQPTADTEGQDSAWNPMGLRSDDIRIALMFLFFVQVGFFGTGNVASISSFYLEPVYRLVPIFNPFLMASLLIYKILAPYVILSASFATLNARLGMPPFALYLVALTLTDGMTLTFFFTVTDTGSWLQIGQSISHFCITSLLLVFSAGIAAAGEVLVGKDALARIKPQRGKKDVFRPS